MRAAADSLRAMRELGALAPDGEIYVAGRAEGPLQDLSFAAKDNFDVAGHTTGCGNPDWAATHAPAPISASAVERLTEAGASLIGKTALDELAYGMLGVNAHYGTPLNPRAHDRVPGGSSSGSASAVAGGCVDFALGSDSACSVRLPAALCGAYGFRPTHGRVDPAGLVPLSPSLDTVGWIAGDATVMRRVGEVLLTGFQASSPARRLLIADDALALVTPDAAPHLSAGIERLGRAFESTDRITVGCADFPLESFWFHAWSVQIREVWAVHGAWITGARPTSQVLSRENLREGAESTAERNVEAASHWQALRAHLRQQIPPGNVLCIPTVAGVAPRLGCDTETRRRFTHPSLCLLSIATLGGLPQLQVPIEDGSEFPFGLSLLGAPGHDEQLLDLGLDAGAMLR